MDRPVPEGDGAAWIAGFMAEQVASFGVALIPPADRETHEAALGNAVRSALAEAPLADPFGVEAFLELLRRAALHLPPSSPVRRGLLTASHRIVRSLLPSVKRDREGLDRAVETLRRLDELILDDDPDRHQLLTMLSGVLVDRFALCAGVDDLRAAVEASRTVVAVLPEHDPYHAKYRFNLAADLSRLSEATGEDGVLDEAVTVARAAAADIPPEDTDRPLALHKLAVILADRYLRTGDGADLDQSVTLRRAAIDAWRAVHDADPAAADAKDRRLFLSGLIHALQLRYERSQDDTDLGEAIDVGRALFEVRSSGALDPDDVAAATNFANVLMSWADQHPDDAGAGAADEAIGLYERVVSASAGTAKSGRDHGNLGLALSRRFRASGSADDLERAISLHRRGMRLTDPDHPDLADHQSHLARALWDRYEPAHDRTDLDEACALYEQAAAQPNAKPESRVRAAYAWGRARAELGEWDRALEGFTVALELLPLLALGRLRPADQAAALRGVFGLASAGAGCALQAGRPEKAVEFLEYGRVVLAEQLLGAEDDLVRLRELSPLLADRFEQLRTRLDGRDPTVGRQGTVIAWNETLRAIRAVFPGFLQPPSVQELLGRLGDRTVVLVNTSDYRSDCLVLRNGTVTVVPLPGLKREEITDQAIDTLRAVALALGGIGQAARRTGEDALSQILDWLWSHVARPALEAADLLGDHAADIGDRHEPPRMWWLPCGLSGYLPLHAAGRPGADGESVLDHVVPSYALTLRALLRDQAPQTRDEAGAPVLLVAVPEEELPGVGREMKALGELVDTAPLVGPAATADAVKARLAHHPVVHFACHGVHNWENPGESRFLLADDPRGGLTVRDFAHLSLPRARLAYLSVCGTAARPSVELLDEALTLSAAMHLAGFRNVVGSLWTVNDLVAVRLVRTVYARMRTGGASGAIDPDRSAAALRSAVLRIRRLHPELPSLWAAPVHVGG